MDYSVPVINNRFFCIVNRDSKDLAAIISSYLSVAGHYLTMFEMPHVTAFKPNEGQIADNTDVNALSRIRAEHLSVRFNNVLARIGAEYIILAGLTDEQRSFLPTYDNINVIEIKKPEDANHCLSSFFETPNSIFACRPDQLLIGLFYAQRRSLWLMVDGSADDVPIEDRTDFQGLVVIEDDNSTNSVIAVNYAFSIDANISIVNSLGAREDHEINHLLEDWGKRDIAGYRVIAKNAYDELEQRVMSRVGQIDFKRFSYATFFTKGLPYSLILKNIIPFSYVNIVANPDLFLINNLIFNGYQLGSAVVFSPLFFSNEETSEISAELTKRNFLVKSIIGKKATVWNISNHLQHFPYDIFHICSHGGEVKGCTIALNFTDMAGQQHTIEYEEVVGYTWIPGTEMFRVGVKYFPLKLDDLRYHTPELETGNFQPHVFSDAIRAINNAKAIDKVIKQPLHIVNNSCSIKCSDSIFQAMIIALASHHSPFIFNNTCYSWSEIGRAFLEAGARGYIGTLWQVDNKVAVECAETFYRDAFSDSIMNGIHHAAKCATGSNSEDIYIFWGLHFTELKETDSLTSANHRVFKELYKAIHRWQEKVKTTSSSTIKKNSQDIMRWIAVELENFDKRKHISKMYQEYLESRKNR